MKIIIASVVVIVLLLIALFVIGGPSVLAPAPEADQNNPENVTSSTGGKLRADTFTGTLETVNTDCFADGECYVMVDGKKVTIQLGWNTEVAGTIMGAPSIGDLESHIGQEIEVYAQDNADGTYTLYGSEGFYVKTLEEPETPTRNEPAPSEVGSAGSCVVAGCSSQLCVDASEGEVMSTCEYREVYACYNTATCERQTTGQCGWTETAELKACVAAAQ